MRKISLIFITLSLLFIALSCDKDLPYPIEDIKRGVVIDIVRIPGTDGLLSDGETSGNYKIKVLIPENQGDYSFMKHAQLLAVLQAPGMETKTAVVVDNITEFPQELEIDIADVYSKLGLTAPALGETLSLTTNVVLDDGSVIPGWTKYTGFNNTNFSGWRVEGRAYSYNVRYAVACGWDRDPDTGSFIGEFTMNEVTPYGNDTYTVTLSHNPSLPDPEDVPIGVNREGLYGVDITPFSPNIWAPVVDVVTVWINPEDLTLIAPNQYTGEDYSNGMGIYWDSFKDMSINSCTRTIQFTVRPYMPGYGGWSFFTFTIAPQE